MLFKFYITEVNISTDYSRCDDIIPNFCFPVGYLILALVCMQATWTHTLGGQGAAYTYQNSDFETCVDYHI